ncbi:restriction endonuclease subunit S [Nostoc sp. ChiSLP03a]|uniref:restriction endonuclease subunit S n=1 Tax=Nostoc sp. ChiSLP03a TaxID=3075380 RepID=UPI002AD443E5|nr:restriction endonuclease subunit S [Nostoc sp. ChiSLP03a]MDZ8216141.1 restriction endonuclease subunit S [Nostoc sp. ChiSLP03a]
MRLQDCQNWEINFDECLTISEKQFHENRRCQLFEGDIVVAIGGYVGNASIARNVKPAVIGQHSAVLPFNPNGNFDERYLLAYLNSAIAETQFNRYVSGSIQAGINLEDLRDIPIPIPHKAIQKYIGDKVRLAERLRERSREREAEAKKLFEDAISWKKQLEYKRNHAYVGVDDLEQRLDLNFNSPNRLSLVQYFRNSQITLEFLDNITEISAMIGWKGLTTDHYTDKGPWLLRGIEFSNGVIDFDSLISIKQYKYDEQPQIHLKQGDIAFTKDGTIGKAIVIPLLSNSLAAGSTVARLRLYSEHKINKYYLEYVLNHPVVQIQVFSFATGMAQPHITQEWIARLQIPRCKIEQEIGNRIHFHHEALVESRNLTTAAKLLVEALIEGKITEDELKTAQQALEKGDREPDKAILSRLTRKGIDIKDEPPLFSDLDALYEIIDQITKDTEEE